jgi:hypothetical protein
VKELIPPLLLRAGPLSIERIGAELGNPNDRTLRIRRCRRCGRRSTGNGCPRARLPRPCGRFSGWSKGVSND